MHKLPPHSVESEQSVLGGLMLDNRAWVDVADILRSDDFYRDDHRLLFAAIADLSEAGKPADSVTVVEALRERGDLGRVPAQYVGQLVADTPSAANIRAYAGAVRDRSMERQMIAVGTDMVESGFAQNGRSVGEKLDQAEVAISAIRDAKTGKGPVSIRQALNEAIESLEAAYESGSAITGLETGIADLDNLTAGLQPSDLIYVAGRPSMGKTGFALQVADHAALNLGNRVLVFSMEMSRRQLTQRSLARVGGVPMQRIRNGQLLDDDWPKLTQATAKLNGADILIDDTPGLTALELRARARREHRKALLSLIVVDYLQLMAGDSKTESRNAQLEPISRQLKALAKELDIPVLVLSQLNRSVEQRGDKRPVMSDMKDCGGLEQDADLILFIYRDEVYHPDGPHQGIAELIIGKQRNGPCDTVETVFNGEHVRFLPYGGPSLRERENDIKSSRDVVGIDY